VQARSIFTSACFLENDRLLVRPKSRKMGLKGSSLLTRKFPAYTCNVKFETYFFSYNGTGLPGPETPGHDGEGLVAGEGLGSVENLDLEP